MEEAVLPAATIDCPYCAEPINPKSKKCKHCGEILDPQMREIELLKSQRNSPQVFMNAGGGAAAAAAASGTGTTLRRFPHWFHILLSIITSGLWIPVYILMYLFRNKRYYY
ncbi:MULTISPECIES: hypothetical protein [unclassified Mesorhizobium]|uniref:hypothetical protein n=1 Tax=unclassified Mesorhizobium TaxID=325217 RepID=UPI000FCB3A48|nr:MULTISPECIES: hypothetical protein [unclassified Mesorhizobium]RUW74811.1 hypothetical protein EOA31_10320 [Mesorhizobium sp. M4B.F.Ca.ET.049.02.1.2]TGV23229.1 hypothetical protein EN786_25400 [Mesorhizobium sp. M4B.F.Ca.ET.143.01.1.1]